MNGIAHNEKYPESVRSFSFNHHYLSVRGYESLRKYFNNNLPHPATIRSWYANCDLNVKPGVVEGCINILKMKHQELTAAGSGLVISLLFDEMHIRKMFQWCSSSKTMQGFLTIGPSSGTYTEEMAANQVIVFMASGLNCNMQLPIAYHFIKSLDANMRMHVLLKVIDPIIDAGIKIANIVFDGYAPNRKMCELLGANLNVFSDQFKPYFEAKNGGKIMIMLDISHMENLVRNTIGKELVIYDNSNEKIEWDKYVKLVEF